MKTGTQMRIPIFAVTLALAALAYPALLAPAVAQAPPAQKTAPAPPVVPQLQVPPAEKVVLLIRMSLLTLNDALQTGNYTVLRDRGSPAFRTANSAANLARIFAKLEAQNVDLTAVTIMTPQLSDARIEGPEQRLRLKGFFPTQPMQTNFELIYEPVEGRWQLFGISVTPTPPQQVTQQTPQPVASKVPAAAQPTPKAPRAKTEAKK